MTDDITGYLTSIAFYERVERGELSPRALGEILCQQLARFFRAEVSEQFIIDITNTIYYEVIEL